MIMCEKDFSIIVPVFNVESYLEQCLDSLIKQNLKNYEIILVNDGSTDKSIEICNKYAEKNLNIRLINQENKGLGAARNIGIQNAIGKYITFVDSDDFVEEDMYYGMLSQAFADDLDLIVFNMKYYYEDGSTKPLTFKLEGNKIYNRQELIEAFLTKKFESFACNKLFKRELFNEIRYDEGVYYEDIYTCFKILNRVNTAKAICEELYYYRQRNNNITSSVSINCLNDFRSAVNKVNSDYEITSKTSRFLIQSFNIIYCCTYLDLIIKANKYKIIRENIKLENYFKNFPVDMLIIFKNPYLDMKYKMIILSWKTHLLYLIKKTRRK